MRGTINLRPVIETDAAFILSLEARPEVEARIGRLTGATNRLVSLRIIEETGESVGIVGIGRSSAFEGKDVELFCAIASGREGGGIATKACRALLKEYQLPTSTARILACVAPDNPAGSALAKHLGFVRLTSNRPNGEYVFALPA